MFDMTMRAKLLPAPCLIKNSVNGENNCNYEIYLLELLNESKWFRVRYPEGFIKPVSESNGECCIFRKNCASVPEERSAVPIQTEQSSAG